MQIPQTWQHQLQANLVNLRAFSQWEQALQHDMTHGNNSVALSLTDFKMSKIHKSSITRI